MDQLKIKTQFAKRVISTLIASKLKKKLNDEYVDVVIHDLDVVHGNDSNMFTIHVATTINCSSDTVKKLISGIE